MRRGGYNPLKLGMLLTVDVPMQITSPRTIDHVSLARLMRPLTSRKVRGWLDARERPWGGEFFITWVQSLKGGVTSKITPTPSIFCKTVK